MTTHPPSSAGATDAPRVLVARDVPAVASVLADHLIDTIAFRLKDEWVSMAHVALTGGPLAAAVCEVVSDSHRRSEVDWSKVHVWWTDENFYPTGHIGRHDARAMLAGLGRVGVPSGNIHAIDGPDRVGDDGLERTAASYAEKLLKMAPEGRVTPVFDLVLLSVGPKGEVGALFPDHPALEATTPTVAIYDAPGQVTQRVTLTLPVLNTATRIWLLASGTECTVAVGRAISGTAGTKLPAAQVRGVIETRWWLDEKAARAVPVDLHEGFGATMAPTTSVTLPQKAGPGAATPTPGPSGSSVLVPQ